MFGYQLSRNKNQRKALFRSLILSLIEKSRIQTTLIKAKAIQAETEKLITKAKSGTLSDRRLALRFLAKKESVNRLFDVIAPVFKNRNGGYTRIVKTLTRRGDQAVMAQISLTEEIPVVEKMEKNVKSKVKKADAKTN